MEHTISTMQELPIFDWELSLRLANQNVSLAKDILNLFLKQLPCDLNALKNALHKQQWDHFLRELHKLHGATCYTGVPRLKILIKSLEDKMRHDIKAFDNNLFSEIESEILQLLKKEMLSEL